MPSGTDSVGVSMIPNTIALVFWAGGRPATLDRAHRVGVGVEVVLLERPGGQRLLARELHGSRRTREHADDLVRVDQPAAARLDDLALVVLRGLERLVMGRAPGELEPAAGRVGEHDLDGLRRRLGPRAVEHVEAHHDLLEAEVSRRRIQAARERVDQLAIEVDRRRRGEHQPVPLEPPARVAQLEMVAQAARGLEEVALERRDVQARLAPVGLVGRAPAHVGEHEQALVAGDLRAARVEAVDVLGRLEPLDRELAQPRQIDPRGGLGVDAVEIAVFAHRRRAVAERVLEREMHRAPAGGEQREREALGGERRAEQRRDRLRDARHRILVGNRHEQLDRVDAAARRADRRGARGAAEPLQRRPEVRRLRHAAEHDAIARQVEALDVHRTHDARGVGERPLVRVQPPDVRGDRDRAPARIGVGEPAPDAVEHRARRSREVGEHRFGRVRDRGLGGREPALHLLGGALGLALEPRPFEDRIARFEREVGERVGDVAAQARDALEHVVEPAIVAEVDPAAGQRVHAREAAEHEPPPQLGRGLRGEQAQQRALERLGRREVVHAVVRERAQQARAERLGQPSAALAIAPHGIEQDRAARRAGLAGGPRQRGAAEQLLDVGEQHELVAHRRELPAEALREIVGQRRFEERRELLAAPDVDVVAHQHAPDLLARRLHRGEPLELGRHLRAQQIGDAALAREERVERIRLALEREARRRRRRRLLRRARSRAGARPRPPAGRRGRRPPSPRPRSAPRIRSPSSSLRGGRAVRPLRRGRRAATASETTIAGVPARTWPAAPVEKR